MRFDCLEVAHEALQQLGGALRAIAGRDRDLAQQLRRAAASIVSNIDERAGVDGARRVNHYRIALGSAREVTSQLRVALAWRYVDRDAVEPALATLDRVRPMLWRLTR